MSDTKAGGLTIKDYGQQVPKNKKEARKDLEDRYGEVWDTDQMRKEFEVVGFLAPFVVVVRRSDNQKGTLEFTHDPRLYFAFRKG